VKKNQQELPERKIAGVILDFIGHIPGTDELKSDMPFDRAGTFGKDSSLTKEQMLYCLCVL
jgi:hypothetical protein